MKNLKIYNTFNLLGHSPKYFKGLLDSRSLLTSSSVVSNVNETNLNKINLNETNSNHSKDIDKTHANLIHIKNIVSYLPALIILIINLFPSICYVVYFVPILRLLLFNLIFNLLISIFITIPCLTISLAIIQFIYKYITRNRKKIKYCFSYNLNKLLLNGKFLLLSGILNTIYNTFVLSFFHTEIIKPSYNLSFVVYILILGTLITIAHCYTRDKKYISVTSMGFLMYVIMIYIVTKSILFGFILPIFFNFNELNCVKNANPAQDRIQVKKPEDYDPEYDKKKVEAVRPNDPEAYDVFGVIERLGNSLLPTQQILDINSSLDITWPIMINSTEGRGWGRATNIKRDIIPYSTPYTFMKHYPIPAIKLGENMLEEAKAINIPNEEIKMVIYAYVSSLSGQKNYYSDCCNHLTVVRCLLNDYPNKAVNLRDINQRHQTYIIKVFKYIDWFNNKTSRSLEEHFDYSLVGNKGYTLTMIEAGAIKSQSVYKYWYNNYSNILEENEEYLKNRDTHHYYYYLTKTWSNLEEKHMGTNSVFFSSSDKALFRETFEKARIDEFR